MKAVIEEDRDVALAHFLLQSELEPLLCGTDRERLVHMLHHAVSASSWRCASFLLRIGVSALSVAPDQVCVAQSIAMKASMDVCNEMVQFASRQSTGRGYLVAMICLNCKSGVHLDTSTLADDGSIEWAIAADDWPMLCKRMVQMSLHNIKYFARLAHAVECLDRLQDTQPLPSYSMPLRSQSARHAAARAVMVSELTSVLERDDSSSPLLQRFASIVFPDVVHVPIFEQTMERFDSLLTLCTLMYARTCARFVFRMHHSKKTCVTRFTFAFIQIWMCLTEEEALHVIHQQGVHDMRSTNVRGESPLSVCLHRRWCRAAHLILTKDESARALLTRGVHIRASPAFQAAVFCTDMPLMGEIIFKRVCDLVPRSVFDFEMIVFFNAITQDIEQVAHRKAIVYALRSMQRVLIPCVWQCVLLRVQTLFEKYVSPHHISFMIESNFPIHIDTLSAYCVSRQITDEQTVLLLMHFFKIPRRDKDVTHVICKCCVSQKARACMYLHTSVRPFSHADLCVLMQNKQPNIALVVDLLACGVLPVTHAMRLLVQDRQDATIEVLCCTRMPRRPYEKSFAHLLFQSCADEDIIKVLASIDSARMLRATLLSQNEAGAFALAALFSNQRAGTVRYLLERDPLVIEYACTNRISLLNMKDYTNEMIISALEHTDLIMTLIRCGFQPLSHIHMIAQLLRVHCIEACFRLFGAQRMCATDRNGNTIAHVVASLPFSNRNDAKCKAFIQLIREHAPPLFYLPNRSGMTPLELARRCTFTLFEEEFLRCIQEKSEFDMILCE